MKEIVTCRQMKALDLHTIEEKKMPSLRTHGAGSPGCCCGDGAVSHKRDRVLVVCGSGNNGGDGAALARILTLTVLTQPFFWWKKITRIPQNFPASLKLPGGSRRLRVNNPDWSEYTTIVDAIFGVGLSRPVEGFCGGIGHINASSAKKWRWIFLRIHGDSGQVLGTAVSADLTVTFAWRKQGLCFLSRAQLCRKNRGCGYRHLRRRKQKRHCPASEPEDLCLLPGRRPTETREPSEKCSW